jgi:arsenical pump membrane protein
MFNVVAGLVILGVVLVGVVWRPRIARLWPDGMPAFVPAGVGAIVAIVLGLVGLAMLTIIVGRVWDAAFTLIGLFMLAAALEANHFFEWAALHLAHAAHGSRWKLYVFLCLLTIVVTIFLGNDGAILGMTAIVAQLVKKAFPVKALPEEISAEEVLPEEVLAGKGLAGKILAGKILARKTVPEKIVARKTLSGKIVPENPLVWLPYIFATGFLADAFSGFLVPDNLTNIIVASTYHLPFLLFLVQMSLPMVLAAIVAISFFALRFRHVLLERDAFYNVELLEKPGDMLEDTLIFRVSWIGLFILIAGHLVIGGVFHQPVSFVVVPIALFILGFVHFRELRTADKILLEAPWSVLIYALGMFVVITAAMTPSVINAFLGIGPLHSLILGQKTLSGVFATGGLMAFLSAVTNNLPATLAGVLLLGTVQHPHMLAIYSVILGVDIGPKLTPYGSLATLLWLSILKREGITISWGQCFKENWWIAVLALAAALIGLWAVVP